MKVRNFLFIGVMAVMIIAIAVNASGQGDFALTPSMATLDKPSSQLPLEPIQEPPQESVQQPTNEVEQEPIQTYTPQAEYTNMGTYKLTAYCSCEICCGYWATIRPTDENGNPIVYGATGETLKQGVSVAADTSILPFGTVILINDQEYIVQDVGGAIKGKEIDVYFSSHEDAREFGVRYEEILRKEKTDVLF